MNTRKHTFQLILAKSYAMCLLICLIGYGAEYVGAQTTAPCLPIRTSQIMPSTNLTQSGRFSIDQIADGITSDALPYNGLDTAQNAGTICLELDQEYDLNSFLLWNDVNIGGQGIGSFSLSFFDINGNLITSIASSTTNGPFVGPLNQVLQEEYIFDSVVERVKKVELIVTSVWGNNGLEIREVEFCGLPSRDCTFESKDILCELENGQLTGNFILTGLFTNFQNNPGTRLLLPPNATTPNGVEVCFGSGVQVLSLDPPLNNGDSFDIGAGVSNSDAIVIKNAMPGDEVCFNLILLGENGVECCHIEVCVEMPPCDCLQVDRRFDEITDVVCNDDGTVDFSYTFQLTNLFGQDVYHAFLASNGTESFSPDYFDLFVANGNAPLGQGQSVSLTTFVTGAQPQDLVSFLITLHVEDFSECCSRDHDVLSPECVDGDVNGVDPLAVISDVGGLLGDVNGDGVLDFSDIPALIGILSSGGFQFEADIDRNGVVDFSDIPEFIAILSQ